jgi:hypothetical protein
MILVAIVCAGCWAYRQLTMVEISEPFDVDGYVSYTLPDEENAFTYYRRALEKLVSEEAVFAGNPSFKREEFWKSWHAAAETGWGHAVPSLRQWAKLNRPLLAELNRGAACAESLEFPLADAANANALSVDWGTLQTCFRVQTLEGLRLTAEHHPAAAWGCFRNTLRSSRHLAMHAGGIETMLGVAIGDQAVRGTVVWAGDPSVGPADLRQAIHDLLAVEAMRAPASDQIKLEYIALRSYAEKGTIGGTPTRSWVRATGYPAQIGNCARKVVANLLSQADRPKYQRTAVHPGELHLFELDPAAAHDPKLLPPQEIEAAAANSATLLAHASNQSCPMPPSNWSIAIRRFCSARSGERANGATPRKLVAPACCWRLRWNSTIASTTNSRRRSRHWSRTAFSNRFLSIRSAPASRTITVAKLPPSVARRCGASTQTELTTAAPTCVTEKETWSYACPLRAPTTNRRSNRFQSTPGTNETPAQ